MALGFIKKVFTFGKDKPSEPGVPSETGVPSEIGVDAGLSAEEKAAIAAESEPHDRVEQLPLAEDPVLAEEVDTAGGPSDDLADDDDVTADDLSLLPLSLLEAEEAADEHPSDATPSFDELLDEAEGAAPGTEIALPKGFSTVVEPEPEPETPEVKQSWFQRLKAGLFRTSSQLTGQISALFTKRKLDEETLEELEDLLIQADLGVETAMRVTGTLSSERYGKDVTGEDVTRIMAAEIVKVLKPVAKPLALDLNHKPHVILVVGVNGTGKTTTIGKLAAKLSGSGLKVMLAAGDTFRAAAIEQLKIWADRTGSTFIGTKLGADAAGLAYDAFEKAKAEKSDVLIIDTAGRLQNKTELMDELEKIVRVLSKLDPDAPHTVLQTLDATTGQNAMNQVEIFRNVAGVNGLIMTKLDGTARGGILVAIAAKHKLPVYFIGVGEGVDDLEPFEAEDFARAIAGFGPSS
ncbi:signal recognition particle-docking protein FtsY [Agrobacterium vitis]|uniref:signal recognition particle-docking protein FtsY n=1 Tax=Agrobacterium vitis TaxID=373 RepID=UPI0012E711E4|nr:signal recognition particle-docking protein FtsY [Agrobacterium vitis]MVA72563.1 signal recognition particle-docking protein FtsY [Agrobacterium vitis]